MAEEMSPDEVATELTPYLLPGPATPESIADHLREQADAAREADVATVPGAFEQLVDATLEAVANGTAGVQEDVVTQAAVPDVDLATGQAPTTIWCGTDDLVAPPAFARWWAGVLPNTEMVEIDGGSHALVFPHWADILARLATGNPHRGTQAPHWN
jgi:pimeloyl-ACP methyl ester carboxylesterase